MDNIKNRLFNNLVKCEKSITAGTIQRISDIYPEKNGQTKLIAKKFIEKSDAMTMSFLGNPMGNNDQNQSEEFVSYIESKGKLMADFFYECLNLILVDGKVPNAYNATAEKSTENIVDWEVLMKRFAKASEDCVEPIVERKSDMIPISMCALWTLDKTGNSSYPDVGDETSSFMMDTFFDIIGRTNANKSRRNLFKKKPCTFSKILAWDPNDLSDDVMSVYININGHYHPVTFFFEEEDEDGNPKPDTPLLESGEKRFGMEPHYGAMNSAREYLGDSLNTTLAEFQKFATSKAYDPIDENITAISEKAVECIDTAKSKFEKENDVNYHGMIESVGDMLLELSSIIKKAKETCEGIEKSSEDQDFFSDFLGENISIIYGSISMFAQCMLLSLAQASLSINNDGKDILEKIEKKESEDVFDKCAEDGSILLTVFCKYIVLDVMSSIGNDDINLIQEFDMFAPIKHEFAPVPSKKKEKKSNKKRQHCPVETESQPPAQIKKTSISAQPETSAKPLLLLLDDDEDDDDDDVIISENGTKVEKKVPRIEELEDDNEVVEISAHPISRNNSGSPLPFAVSSALKSLVKKTHTIGMKHKNTFEPFGNPDEVKNLKELSVRCILPPRKLAYKKTYDGWGKETDLSEIDMYLEPFQMCDKTECELDQDAIVSWVESDKISHFEMAKAMQDNLEKDRRTMYELSDEFSKAPTKELKARIIALNISIGLQVDQIRKSFFIPFV